MNGFDHAILAFLNQFAFRFPRFDVAVGLIESRHLFKGIAIMALFWAAWFLPESRSQKNRTILICTIAGGLVALLFGRLLALWLPFRVRPLYNLSLQMNFPVADPTAFLRTWSAFPSDHAMLWTAISFGIFLVSRRLGIVALIYTALFICLPRIYMGLHHPTDVLAGALLGVLLVLVMCSGGVRKLVSSRAVHWSHQRQAGFYICFFLLTYGMGTNFDEVRGLAKQFSSPNAPALVLSH